MQFNKLFWALYDIQYVCNISRQYLSWTRPKEQNSGGIQTYKKIKLEASELKPSTRAALFIIEMDDNTKKLHILYTSAFHCHYCDPAKNFAKIEKCCQLFKILKKFSKMGKNVGKKIKWRTKNCPIFREYIYWKILCHSAKIWMEVSWQYVKIQEFLNFAKMLKTSICP